MRRQADLMQSASSVWCTPVSVSGVHPRASWVYTPSLLGVHPGPLWYTPPSTCKPLRCVPMSSRILRHRARHIGGRRNRLYITAQSVFPVKIHFAQLSCNPSYAVSRSSTAEGTSISSHVPPHLSIGDGKFRVYRLQTHDYIAMEHHVNCVTEIA